MTYSDDYFSAYDVDWFALNRVGGIAHFTSGGCGYIPENIKREFAQVVKFTDFVASLDETTDVEIVEENIPNISELRYGVDAYLSSFMEFASKGFYSYDVAEEVGQCQGYKLIAIPKKNVSFTELPEVFRKKTMFGNLRESEFKEELNSTDWTEL